MNFYGIYLKYSKDGKTKYYTRFKFAKSIDRLRQGVKAKIAGTNWELINVYFIREADSFERWHHTPKKQKRY